MRTSSRRPCASEGPWNAHADKARLSPATQNFCPGPFGRCGSAGARRWVNQRCNEIDAPQVAFRIPTAPHVYGPSLAQGRRSRVLWLARRSRVLLLTRRSRVLRLTRRTRLLWLARRSRVLRLTRWTRVLWLARRSRVLRLARRTRVVWLARRSRVLRPGRRSPVRGFCGQGDNLPSLAWRGMTATAPVRRPCATAPVRRPCVTAPVRARGASRPPSRRRPGPWRLRPVPAKCTTGDTPPRSTARQAGMACPAHL